MAETLSPEQAAALQKQNCIFCKIIKGEIPSKTVHEDNLCAAILDINPANEGHIILLPKEHYSIMPQVPKDVLSHMAAVTKKISKALLLSTFGKSTSIFVANGAVAGQKAPHFMVHIIPRKAANEFFEIPQKQINSLDLDKVKEILIVKLEAITGRKFADKNIESPSKPAVETIPVNRQDIEEINVIERSMVHDFEQTPKHEKKIVKVGIKKEKGYLYYIDKDGDVARVPMARGGKKAKGKSEKVEILNKEDEDEKDNTSSDSESDGGKSRPSLDDISRMLLGGRI